MSDANIHTIMCPICGGDAFRPYKLGLLQCKDCSAVVSPAVWQPQANEGMEEEWFGEEYRPDTSFWVALFESWNNRRSLGRLERTHPPGHRLLEIGVGSGSFLEAARAEGYQVMGCDLSGPICRRVQQRYGIAMHCGPLETLKAEESFDVIVLNHVVEHVQQPVAFLQDVLYRLSPGGVVHIAVPNIACWEARLSGWTSFEPYHLIYFVPQTLERTVVASGLSIDRLATHDSFSGWFLAVLRTVVGVNRAVGAVTRSATALTRRTEDRRSKAVEHAYRIAMICVGGGLWPLRWLQAKLSRGDEIICIARKP